MARYILAEEMMGFYEVEINSNTIYLQKFNQAAGVVELTLEDEAKAEYFDGHEYKDKGFVRPTHKIVVQIPTKP